MIWLKPQAHRQGPVQELSCPQTPSSTTRSSLLMALLLLLPGLEEFRKMIKNKVGGWFYEACWPNPTRFKPCPSNKLNFGLRKGGKEGKAGAWALYRSSPSPS